MKILLVEDNEDHALMVREALPGHSLVEVTSLRQALELDDLSGFDVALTDLSLPDAQGVEAVEAFRLSAPEVPLIVLSSVSDDGTAQLALERGAKDYLVKEEILSDHRLAIGTFNRSMRYAVLRHKAQRENRRLMRSLQDSKSLLEIKNKRLRSTCDTAHKFVENVSHDFRTPLAVIKEFSSLIRDGVVGDVNLEQRRMLHIIEDRADDLNIMVDDLLDASKLEAGLLNMWRRKTSVAAIAKHSVPGMERKAEIKGVTLSVKIDAELPDVFCDKEKAERVIVNLVANAIKFCEKGCRVELWATANYQLQEVVVGVADDGPGIPQEMLETIFERFKQGACGVRQDVKGFGLGLSIARELVDLNLGRLEVTSVIGKGSTFSFSIPLADADEIIVRYIKRVRKLEGGCSVCSALTITTTASASPRDADELDAFLCHNVRRDDLALRVGDGRWLMLLLVPPVEVEEFVARIRRELTDVNRNQPLGPLPEIEFHEEGVLRLTDSLSDLKQRTVTLLAPREACHV